MSTLMLAQEEGAPSSHTPFLGHFLPHDPLGVGISPQDNQSIDWAVTHHTEQLNKMS